MKKIILSVFAVIIAAYSCVWWTQTSRLKHVVEEICKNYGIQNEGISRKGFPFTFAVALKNLKTDSQSFDGKCIIGANLFSKKGWIQLEGNLQNSCLFEGNLTVTHPNFFALLKKSESEADFLLDFWRDATLVTDGLRISKDDPSLLLSITGGNLELHTLDYQNNQLTTGLNFDLYGMTSNNGFSSAMPTDLHCRAKTTISIEHHKFFLLSLDIKDFSSFNAYTPYTAQGQLSLEPKGTDFTTHLTFTADQQFLKNLPTLDQEQFFTILDPLFSQFPQFKAFCANNWDQLPLLAPDLPSFGTFHNHFDVTVFGSLEPAFEVKEIEISKWEQQCDQYGIEISGKTNRQEGKFALQLTHHRDFLSDLAQYYNRIRPIFSQDFGDLPELNGKVASKIATVLETLAASSSLDAIEYQIELAGQAVLINSKPAEEFLISAAPLLSEVAAEIFPAPIPVTEQL